LPEKPSKFVNILLWIIQFLQSLTFLWSGSMKLFDPAALPWQWIRDDPGLVKITAFFDLSAGFGLVLPALLRIKPGLTVYAAYGAILLMIAASIYHISRGEGSQIGFNIFMLALAAFIAWGRLKYAPIQLKK
jgi:uncharacterized membrane protein YphA (DoxX/SURF4 family)